MDTECAVLWSVPVPGGAQACEIDFLVAHCRLGLALIEVKAPTIVPGKDGWVDFRDGSAFGREPPEKQLEQATNAVKTWWKEWHPGLSLPRMERFVVLANTPHDVLTANQRFLVPGGHVALPDGTSRVLQQRRQAYLCAGDLLPLLPAMILQVLTDEFGKSRRSDVEETFFQEAVPHLVHQAGARDVRTAARGGVTDATPRSHSPSKSWRQRRWTRYGVAATVALAVGWYWLHPAPPPPSAPLAPTAHLAPAVHGDATAVKKPSVVQKPKTAKLAKSDDGAGLKPVLDAKGRSCVERHTAGTIGGEAVDLVEKLCRAPDGALQRVSD